MTIRESPSRVEARAGRIIDVWMRAGFREVEVYAKFARTETAAAAGGAILRAESREESGLAVRASCGAEAMAFAAASWCEPDPAPPRPWEPSRESDIPMLPDAPIRSLKWDGAIDRPDRAGITAAATQAAGAFDRVEISGTALATGLFNSHGIAIAQSATLCTRTLRTGRIERIHAGRSLDRLGEASAAGEWRSLSQALAGAPEVPCPERFLLAPSAAARILSLFIELIGAGRVRQRRSPFAAGSSLSPALTILDRGGDGPFGTEFDGEGVAVQPGVIAEGGRIESLLYDTREAARAGRRSAGNCMRDSYLSQPRIGTAFLETKPGHVSLDALRSEAAIEIADLPEILRFQDTTGNLAARGWGWRLRDGQRRDLVTLTLSSNLPTLLGSVSACGEDLDHFAYAGWMGSPTLLIVMPGGRP